MFETVRLFLFAEPLRLLIMICWAVCLGGFSFYCIGIAREITYVTLADGRQQERKIPLVFRLLLPFVPNILHLVSRPEFKNSSDTADKKLTAAGYEGLLKGTEFLAIKFMMPLACGTLWFGILSLINRMLPTLLGDNFILLFVMGLMFFYSYPIFWLNRSLKQRHLAIQRALPFVLDLLTLSVEAGMDFMTSLQRNCERRKLDALNEELIRMTREIQVGLPRRVALKNMATRVDLADLRSVSNALIQADELGVSIGAILRIQSDQMRSRRFDRAEKLANEAPVKMLFPLMLFIFPAVFVILLGPILRDTMNQLF
jgi:tight adherence protein C